MLTNAQGANYALHHARWIASSRCRSSYLPPAAGTIAVTARGYPTDEDEKAVDRARARHQFRVKAAERDRREKKICVRARLNYQNSTATRRT
jgi:hypothetical protein